MKLFHAHIYYDQDDISKIKALKQLALKSPLKVWRFFEKQVGPHALPMLELHFTDNEETLAMAWLTENHGEFSVLIHEDTGDDVKDHEQARWLGKVLPIRYEFFEEVKRDPKVAVHQKS